MCYFHCETRPDVKKLVKDEVERRKKAKRADASERCVLEQAILAFFKPPTAELVAKGVQYENEEAYKVSLKDGIPDSVRLQELADSLASPWIEYTCDWNGAYGSVYMPKVPGTVPRHPPEMYGHPFKRKT